MTNRDSLQRNEALLLLLSHFTAARTGTAPTLPSWDRVLGETSTEVVSRFLAEGLLHPATLSAKIHSAFSAAEMKVLLKKRGLRVSGTKQDLAARLITADPEGAAAEVAHLNML